jgi:hypothetical protein
MGMFLGGEAFLEKERFLASRLAGVYVKLTIV